MMGKKKFVFNFIFFLSAPIFFSCEEFITNPEFLNPDLGNWQLQYIANNDLYYWDLFFADKNCGWAAADSGKIIATTDGGENWLSQESRITDKIRSIYFINDKTGWAAGGRNILHTEDGGSSWKVQFFDNDTTELFQPKIYYQIIFLNELSGWAANNYGEILNTTNGGLSWERQIYWETGGAAAFSFISNEIGFAFVPAYELYKTMDGGNSWNKEKIQGIKFATGFAFVTEREGWILTSYAPSSAIESGSPIYRTSDGGKNWNFVATIPDLILTSISFLDENNICISGSSGIYITRNKGKDWQKSLNGSFIIDIAVVDKSNAWALGFNGQIFKYVRYSK
jgi:photosystem II stability/assembly factor-like uncharacterized protein